MVKKQTNKQTPLLKQEMERCSLDPWLRKIPWRRAWRLTPVFLPGESHGERSLAGYSPCGRKELNMTEATEHICHLQDPLHL